MQCMAALWSWSWRGIVSEGDIGQVLVPVVRIPRFTDFGQHIEDGAIQILCLPITARIELGGVDAVHAEHLRQACCQVRSELHSPVSENVAGEAHLQHISDNNTISTS